MFSGKKKKEIVGNKVEIIVNRQEMLNSDKRYSNGYRADFEMCKSCYDYLNKAYSCVNPLNPNIEGKVLSVRNMACVGNVIIAFKKSDSNFYWHELSDFIHNYNSDEPVSYNEYQLFKTLFEIGTSKV